jgi:hypothetical protein
MHSPAVSVPQYVFEGCGDFDPLGFPNVIFVARFVVAAGRSHPISGVMHPLDANN